MRAISFSRVSTPGQMTDDRFGIARQQAANATGQHIHNLEIVYCIDVQESGKYMLENPTFKKVIADLEANLADGVLVAEQSRLVRPVDFEDFLVLYQFQRLKKMIWTPSQAIKPWTPEGMMILGITGLMNGMELKQNHDRMHGAREEMRKAGLSGCGGNAIPRGVLFHKPRAGKPGYWEYDPTGRGTMPEGENYLDRVKEAFRMLIEDDASYEPIARLLDVCERSAQNMLQNALWIGYNVRKTERLTAEPRVIQKRRTPLKEGQSERRYKPLRPLAEPEWIATNLLDAPLIDRETFDRAQRIVAARKGHYSKNARAADVLMPGEMIKCPCGDHYYYKADKRKRADGNEADYSRMYCASRHPGRKRQTKATRYKTFVACPSESFKTSFFEATIERIMVAAATGKLIVEALDEFAKANRRAPAKAKSIDAELQVIDAGLRKGLREYMTGKVAEDMWVTIRDEFEAKKRALLADRPEPVAVMYDANSLAKEIAAALAEFANFERAEKRDLLRRAIKEIQVGYEAEILGFKLSGGFLGSLEGWGKPGKRSQASSQFTPQDIVIRFNKPDPIRLAA